MTYLRFHLFFNLPPTLLLAWLTRDAWRPAHAAALGIVLLLSLLFTTPWDNAAARRGIWGFAPDKSGRKIGWLPWEEYLFFFWQGVNVVGLALWILPAWRCGLATPFGPANGIGLLVLGVLWIAAGRLRLAARWNYARHLFYWFLPVIFAQWIVAPGLCWALAPFLALVCGIGGIYFSAADWVAVRAGVWFFDAEQITGRKIGGLPWEEVAFFFLTSLLVAQSWLLFLPASLR